MVLDDLLHKLGNTTYIRLGNPLKRPLSKVWAGLGLSRWVNGGVYATSPWAIENSPYIVMNNVLVEENVNLTIQSGVHVKFNSDKYLRVDGTLFAVGTEAMMIIFTSNKTSPAPGDWGGIRFKNTCQEGILSYCIIVIRHDYGSDC